MKLHMKVDKVTILDHEYVYIAMYYKIQFDMLTIQWLHLSKVENKLWLR